MKKSKIKKIGVAFIFLYVCYILLSQQITIKNKRAELENYNAELKAVTEEYKELKDKTELTKTNRYVERLAREKLGLIKEGENTVIQQKN